MNENESETIELPNEPVPKDWKKLPFKVGDVVCRGSSVKSPAKIVGIRRNTEYNVTLYVVTAKKRFCEWSGSVYYFSDPEQRADRFYNISQYYKDRADDIMQRAEAAKLVTP